MRHQRHVHQHVYQQSGTRGSTIALMDVHARLAGAFSTKRGIGVATSGWSMSDATKLGSRYCFVLYSLHCTVCTESRLCWAGWEIAASVLSYQSIALGRSGHLILRTHLGTRVVLQN